MRVLFIGDRGNGGIRSHLQCLLKALPSDIERYAIGEDEPFAGANGHDLREWRQIRRVVRRFRPDVIHFHTPNLLMALYARFFSRAKLVCSWHTPTVDAQPSLGQRLFFALLGRRCYFLPVSHVTWRGLKQWLPYAQGEVFFNPLLLSAYDRTPREIAASPAVVGMVGRAAAQKDWPSFHEVERLVRAKRPDVTFLNAGETAFCNGREAIRSMDLFLMTSKHEELPTTLLECFALGTPVCGFIPVGGTQDVLAFSSGPVRSAFVATRDCRVLADMVLRLLADADARRAIAADGCRIVEDHFDAARLCRDQLAKVYAR